MQSITYMNGNVKLMFSGKCYLISIMISFVKGEDSDAAHW